MSYEHRFISKCFSLDAMLDTHEHLENVEEIWMQIYAASEKQHFCFPAWLSHYIAQEAIVQTVVLLSPALHPTVTHIILVYSKEEEKK